MSQRRYELSDDELSEILDGNISKSLQAKISASPELDRLVRQSLQIEQSIRVALTPPTPEQISEYVSGDISFEKKQYIDLLVAIDQELWVEVEASRQFMADASLQPSAIDERYVASKHFIAALNPSSTHHGAFQAVRRSNSLDKQIVSSADGLEIVIEIRSGGTQLEISGSFFEESGSGETDGIVEIWSRDTLIAVLRTHGGAFYCTMPIAAPLDARMFLGRSHRFSITLLNHEGL